MTSPFKTPLKVRPLNKTREGRPLFELTEPFVYEVGSLGSEVEVKVPAGFVTDFASIPRIVDNLLGMNPQGRHSKAVVVHDYLYRFPEVADNLSLTVYIRLDWPRRYVWNGRLVADLVMLEASKVAGVHWLTRYTQFIGLRLGGAKAYKRWIDDKA